MQLADMNESEQVGKIIVLTRTLETILEEQFGAAAGKQKSGSKKKTWIALAAAAAALALLSRR